jgi:hypothetical protein
VLPGKGANVVIVVRITDTLRLRWPVPIVGETSEAFDLTHPGTITMPEESQREVEELVRKICAVRNIKSTEGLR